MYNWLSAFGHFENDGDTIVFKGSEISQADQQTTPAVGNLVFNEYFNEGNITAEIEFEQIDNEVGCDIMFYYKNTEIGPELVSVGIDKSTHFMFELKSLKDGKWSFHRFSGDSHVLKENQRYLLEMTYKGSSVSLKVNGIEVLEGKLPFVTTNSQVGIWCRSRFDVKIYNYHIESAKPKVFVIMQYSDQYNELYDDVIKSVCRKHGYEVVRADDIYKNDIIINDIASNIIEAKVIIADVSPRNPNVYYEVGYSHALGKPTVLLAEDGTDLPFDVRPYRVIHYMNSIGGKKKIEESLDKHLSQIV